jgi:hypothetical protein
MQLSCSHYLDHEYKILTYRSFLCFFFTDLIFWFHYSTLDVLKIKFFFYFFFFFAFYNDNSASWSWSHICNASSDWLGVLYNFLFYFYFKFISHFFNCFFLELFFFLIFKLQHCIVKDWTSLFFFFDVIISVSWFNVSMD